MRTCIRCGNPWPEVDFRVGKMQCALCERLTGLERTYRLSEDDAWCLLKYQNHKCAICGKEIDIFIAHLDHAHDSGDIRGFLCPSCNLGLGMFQDNAQNLRCAADYIDKHEHNVRHARGTKN
jgi:hypothetical protein